MAFCWGLIVALFALNVGFSADAQQNTTSAPVQTTASSGGNSNQTTTDAITKSPAGTTSPTGGFYTYLITRFKGDPCPEEKEAAEEKEASLTSTFDSFYANPKFDLEDIPSDVTSDSDACKFSFSFNFTFGPNLQIYNISEVFEDKLKRIDYTVDGMKLTDIKTDVYVDGVILGQFMTKANDCEKICCEGAGGPITLTRTCTPTDRCRSYKLRKEEPCMDVCSTECSGVTTCKISLIVLLFGVFMNWFLK